MGLLGHWPGYLSAPPWLQPPVPTPPAMGICGELTDMVGDIPELLSVTAPSKWIVRKKKRTRF